MDMGTLYCNGLCTLALLRISIIYIAQMTLTQICAIGGDNVCGLWTVVHSLCTCWELSV